MKNIIKLYLTYNRSNNLHIVAVNSLGHTLFKKSYGCYDKSSKLRVLSVQKLFLQLTSFLLEKNYTQLVLVFKGISFLKFAFLREIFAKRFNILKIFYISAQRFNGCRQKKQRRL